MGRFAGIFLARLRGLMPDELNSTEFSALLVPHRHFSLLAQRRATMIVNRVRLFAFLFAVLTPLWAIIDYFAFPLPLWFALGALRFSASIAFVLVVVHYRPSGSLGNAYRAMALLFAIPTLFYVASHQLLSGYSLAGMSAAIATGYAFLPFVLLAGLSIFPLSLFESALFAAPILLAQFLAGMLSWGALDWPTFAGAFWLLALITGVSTLAGMSQLAFMIALVRQAIRDPLTGVFSRRSGEESLDLQFTIAQRSNAALSLAFIDLDHFKSINDSFGHEAGDVVLKEAASTIARYLRRGDMLVRWGGRGVRPDPAQYRPPASGGCDEPPAPGRLWLATGPGAGHGEHRLVGTQGRPLRRLAETDRNRRPADVCRQAARPQPGVRQR